MTVISPAAEALMFAAIDHGIASVADSGQLTPFTMHDAGDGIVLTRFVTDRLEESVERGREFLQAESPGIELAALVHDGYVTTDTERTDAVLVTLHSAGAAHADVFAQRYTIQDGVVGEMGNVQHIAIDAPPLLAAPARRGWLRRR